MRTIIIITVIYFTLIDLGYSKSQQQRKGTQYSTINNTRPKNSLTIKKMKLEIKNLEYRNNKLINELSLKKLILTICSALIGITTILWTIFNGLKTYKFKIASDRTNKITNLLQLAMTDNNKKKLAAIRGLTRYKNEVLEEMISLLVYEKNFYNIQIIINYIQNINKKNRKAIFQINHEFYSLIAKIIGDIRSKGQYDKIDQILDMPKCQIEHISDHFAIDVEVGKMESNSFQNYNLNLLTIILLANSIKKIVAYWLTYNIKSCFYSKGVYLESVNLNKSIIKNIIFNKSIFCNSIIRHANLKNTIFNESLLINTNYIDAKLYNIDFLSSDLSEINFRHTILRKVSFKNVKLQNAIFSESNTERLIYINSNGDNIKCRGVRFKKIKIENCKFYKIELHRALLNNITITKTKLNGSILINTEFNYGILNNVNFNGSNLKGASFFKIQLNKVSFKDCDLNGVVFKNCSLKEIIFDDGYEKDCSFVKSNIE